VTFRFSDSTAVAAGTFNIHVIHPRWLAEVDLLPEGTKVKMSSDFRRPGFRYAFDGIAMEWDVRPERLVIVSKSHKENCGSVLAGVIRNLPWTPLLGVGVNIEFKGTLEDLEAIPKLCQPPPCQAVEGYGTKQQTMHLGLTRGPHVFNMQIAVHEKVELSINVHTELGNKAAPQREVTALAIGACDNFFALREEAVGLAKKLWNLELSYEPNSDV